MSRVVPTTPGIYKLIIGRRYYYGSACNLRRRRDNHLQCLAAGRHGNAILQNAYNKYGKAACRFLVVETVEKRVDLFTREQVWLDKYFGRPFCANIMPKAGGPPGGPKSAETRKRISESLRRRGVRPVAAASRNSALARQRPVVLRFDSAVKAAKALGISKQRLDNYLRGVRAWPAGLTGHHA